MAGYHLCSALRAVSQVRSDKHCSLFTESSSEAQGFKLLLTLALSYKFPRLTNIDRKSFKCFPLS